MAMACFQIGGDRIVEFMEIAVAVRCVCPDSFARNDTNC